MFLLGHIGITVGIIYLLAWLFYSRNKRYNQSSPLVGNIDLRIIIIAAILPDIIDKTVGMIIFKEEISYGRLFMHSMVIIGVFSICFIILSRIKSGRILISLCYISPLWIHLVLDRMWEDPHTLFWPIFGTGFPRIDIEISDYFTILFSDPYIFIGEIVGFLIIVGLLVRHRLFVKVRLFGFLKDGRLKTCSES